jgi:hypothetical protein
VAGLPEDSTVGDTQATREVEVTGIEDWGDALFVSLSNTLNTFLAAIPLVIGAALILLIGWLISNVLARLVQEVLERAGADRLFAQHGGSVYGPRSTTFRPSRIAAEVIRWIVRLVFLVAAANALGLPQVSLLLNQVLLWIPNLIVAAIILLVAPVLARFLRGIIEVGAGQMGFTNATLLGRLAEGALIAFAVLIAVNQLGIAADLINILFIGVVGAIALAFGLAFGLGGRDVAAELTRQWYDASVSAADRVRTAADEPPAMGATRHPGPGAESGTGQTPPTTGFGRPRPEPDGASGR